jgi:hypothetical protein
MSIGEFAVSLRKDCFKVAMRAEQFTRKLRLQKEGTMSELIDDSFEEDDLEGFAPGSPDPESSDSRFMWLEGLLEDPLGDDDK